MLTSSLQNNTLFLSGQARLINIDELFGTLSNYKDDPNLSSIDVTDLSSIDIAGAQVIVSFLKERTDIQLITRADESPICFQHTGLNQFLVISNTDQEALEIS